MTIKSILCIFGGVHNELNVLDSVFYLANKHNAHVCFLHISPDPASYVFGYSEVPPSVGSFVEMAMVENQQRVEKIQKHVLSYAEKYTQSNEIENASTPISVEFKHQIGSNDEAVAQEGRLNDLIIISHPLARINGLYTHAIISALFNTGRPVILLPEKGPVFLQTDKKIISFAWNGSLESVHALQHSMPFMTEAKKVYILRTLKDSKDKNFQNAQGALVKYLDRQGIQADTVVIDDNKHQSIEQAFLAKAKELNSDLLAMGAYGHSRFREVILGGMTDYMLKKADIPLLLSH